MNTDPPTVPRLTIATMVRGADRERLRRCLDAVERQTAPEWQHIVVVDGSVDRRTRTMLERRAARDLRVEIVVRPGTREPASAAAYGAALAAAEAPLFMLLGQHDLLEPDAVAQLCAASTGHDVIAYGDHATVGDFDVEVPYLKPDFSPELLRNTSYIHRPLVVPSSLARAVGGIRPGFEGAIDHDLALRVTEVASEVVHVPAVLYRERATADIDRAAGPCTATSDTGRRAVAEHCARTGVRASVEPTGTDGCYRVHRVPQAQPLVSIVIPTRGSSGRVWGVTRTFVTAAVESIAATSSYRDLEFIIVFDDATPDSVLDSIRRAAGDLRVEFVPFVDEFNFSAKINSGAAAATGDHLLLLNDDTELIDPGSIAVMVAHLDAADVGMVGAKLLFSDGTLQHGGHVYNRTVGHACTGWPGTSAGPLPLQPLAVERECSGVTAAAALVRREIFDAVGGFSDEFPLNYNDVDFSLKVRASGQRIIWSPHASWYHFESRTRRSVLLPEETSLLNSRWHEEINNDPYCNPNIQPDRHDWFERPPQQLSGPDLYRHTS